MRAHLRPVRLILAGHGGVARFSEKRKVGGSTPPLTTRSSSNREPSHLRERRKREIRMAQSALSRSRITAENPQLAHKSAGGFSGRARSRRAAAVPLCTKNIL